MKRSVKAANNDIMQRVTSRFEELIDGELYHAGYEVTCKGVLPNVKLIVTCTKDEPDKMPAIELEVNQLRDGVIDVVPTLTFPTLTASDEDYADSIHYWLTEWAKVGKYITKLNKFEFDIKAYSEDEE